MENFQWAPLPKSRVIVGDINGGYVACEEDQELLEYIQDIDVSTKSSTQAILEGALLTALEENQHLQEPNMTFYSSINRYIWMLIGAYHSAGATPGAMRSVASKMLESGRKDVANYLEHVAKEESGHSDLALLDLQTLGLNAQKLVDQTISNESVRLLDHLNKIIESQNPIKILGYAFALERLALFNNSETLSKAKKILPENKDALKCLRVHSSIGSELAHVDESIEFISQLPKEDRRLIVQCCYETTLIMTRRQHASEEQLTKIIQPFYVPDQLKQA